MQLSVRLNGTNVENWREFTQHFLGFYLVLRGRLRASPTVAGRKSARQTTILLDTKVKITLGQFAARVISLLFQNVHIAFRQQSGKLLFIAPLAPPLGELPK